MNAYHFSEHLFSSPLLYLVAGGHEEGGSVAEHDVLLLPGADVREELALLLLRLIQHLVGLVDG